MIEKGSGRVLATAFAPGSTHDFTLFKSSRLWINPETLLLADSGYQGVAKWHSRTQTPHKNTKLHPLTPLQKQHNSDLARQRVQCENVLGELKRFAILQGPYRNHTKRFALRFNLIAAIHNYHL